MLVNIIIILNMYFMETWHHKQLRESKAIVVKYIWEIIFFNSLTECHNGYCHSKSILKVFFGNIFNFIQLNVSLTCLSIKVVQVCCASVCVLTHACVYACVFVCKTSSLWNQFFLERIDGKCCSSLEYLMGEWQEMCGVETEVAIPDLNYISQNQILTCLLMGKRKLKPRSLKVTSCVTRRNSWV